VRGWRRAGLRAPGAHGASMGGLGRKRGWPEVGFPRRPRRRRGGAHRRGASRRGRRPSLGLIAAARGGEAVGMVGLGGERAEVEARQRQELTGEEGNGGEVVSVEVRPRGVAGERQCGEGKLPRASVQKGILSITFAC
jgi:hypothetical protein